MGFIDRIFKQKHKSEVRAKICFSCGTPLKDGNSSCPQCGSSESRTCAVCHAGVKKEYLYCPECGNRLPCPLCGGKVENHTCLVCGNILFYHHVSFVHILPQVPTPLRFHRVCPKCEAAIGYRLSLDTPYCHQCGTKSVIRFCR